MANLQLQSYIQVHLDLSSPDSRPVVPGLPDGGATFGNESSGAVVVVVKPRNECREGPGRLPERFMQGPQARGASSDPIQVTRSNLTVRYLLCILQ